MAILRSRGARSSTGSPLSRMSPAVGSSRPAIIRRTVDLPQPEGPSRTMNSPSVTSRLMLSTAVVPSGHTLVTSFSETVDTVYLLLAGLRRSGPTTIRDRDNSDELHRRLTIGRKCHSPSVTSRLRQRFDGRPGQALFRFPTSRTLCRAGDELATKNQPVREIGRHRRGQQGEAAGRDRQQ